MSWKVRVAGINKVGANIKIYKSGTGGGVKVVERGYVMLGGALKLFHATIATPPTPAPNPAPPPPTPVPGVVLAVNVSPTSASGTRNLGGVCTTSADSVITVSNGVAPYTYTWSLVSWTASGGGTPAATLPTASATKFSQNLPNPGNTTTATFRCTVQDANLNTGTVDVPVTLSASTSDTGTYVPPTRPPGPIVPPHEY